MTKQKTKIKKLSIGNKSFAELRGEKRFGMVVMGAGKPLSGWVKGIGETLLEEKIVCDKDCFADVYTLSGNVEGSEGRTDLVLIFKQGVGIQTGQLAIWRLQFGSVSWIDDFTRNYAKDYR